jgi:molecular chaperone DnaK
MAHDNKTLGRFILDGIMPAPRGIPQIEVTFDIDANGILNVKAKDKGTGKEQHITITASTGLSKDEVEKMKKDAEAHAEEDKKKKEGIEVKNMAETLIYSTEKAIKDAGDKIGDDIKKPVEEKIEALKKVKDGEDFEAIKKATEELAQVAQKIGEAIYKTPASPEASQGGQNADNKTQEAPGGQTAGGEEKKAEEAEFTEKK